MAEFTGSLAFVSVFVPARNEEANILPCLRSLLNQDYPGGYEILFADDGSEDGTWRLANELAPGNPALHLFKVDPDIFPGIPGKQKALAQLCKKAKGEIFLFCDADMQMPPGWISAMTESLTAGKSDLVNGSTCTETHHLLLALQALDWLLPQALMAAMSRFKIGFTAMGNNMGISRKAYLKMGGYESIPPSFTEDYELYRQASKMGFRLFHIFHTEVLGITRPAKNLSEWFSQHLRWMMGYQKLPWFKKMPLLMNLFIWPLALLLFFLPSGLFWSKLLFIAFGLKMLLFALSLQYIRKPQLIFWLPLYEFVYPFFYGSLLVLSSLNTTVSWKGRKIINSP
jgi:glycosyltransferase involved in cell wall biosynthesis